VGLELEGICFKIERSALCIIDKACATKAIFRRELIYFKKMKLECLKIASKAKCRQHKRQNQGGCISGRTMHSFH
jgi:hypothetical protein